MMLVSVAPVTAMGVSLISLLIVFNPIWEFKIKGIVLLVAFCKRKGIWYGVVIMANPIAALLSVTFVSLILLLLLDLSLVSMSHLVAKWNHVPAQPPTPFMYAHCSIFLLVQAMYLHAKHETVGFHSVSPILCTIIYVHCSIYSF